MASYNSSDCFICGNERENKVSSYYCKICLQVIVYKEQLIIRTNTTKCNCQILIKVGEKKYTKSMRWSNIDTTPNLSSTSLRNNIPIGIQFFMFPKSGIRYAEVI
jgi:hypothetical protein